MKISSYLNIIGINTVETYLVLYFERTIYLTQNDRDTLHDGDGGDDELALVLQVSHILV